MSKYIDTKIFKEMVASLSDEYTVIGEYEGTKKKIEMLHTTCGNTFITVPNRFLNGGRCPICARKRTNNVISRFQYTKLLDIDVKKFLADNGYTMVEPYKNSSTKIKMIHNKCGNEISMLLANFKKGNRCPICANRAKKTTNQYKEEINNVYAGEYTVIGEYNGANKSIEVKHNICGNIFTPKASALLNGRSHCAVCSNNKKMTQFKRMTHEKFLEKISELYNNDIEILDTYNGYNKAVRCRHISCNSIFVKTPAKLIDRLQTCPNCKGSYGEKLVLTSLEKENFSNIIREYSFKTCCDTNVLKFDFYLPNDNIIIEFDGEQHFRPIYGNTYKEKIENFKKTKKHDKIKNNFCKDSKINILRIPFWEQNRIPNIIESLRELKDQYKNISSNRFTVWRRSLKIISYSKFINKKK